MDINKLIIMAKEASENSYSPYSHYKVGAALLTKNGKIYTGTNVENASFPAGMCAERVALFDAVKDGEKEFKQWQSTQKVIIFPFPAEFAGRSFPNSQGTSKLLLPRVKMSMW